MKICFDNVDLSSTSGPNSFATKLKSVLETKGYFCDNSQKPDAQLSFINATQMLAPIFQRLDGIWFNTRQDWETQNRPIKQTYDLAAGIIYQSRFNKQLSEKYFGKKSDYSIIHNGADFETIDNVPVIKNPILDNFSEVWCCASSWRPHKRLTANIEYFLKHSNEKDCLVVAGKDAIENGLINHPRVFYAGELDKFQLISLYKKSSRFLHLAFIDHCPNVVVDARASGCIIVCASSGGTSEIAGSDAIVIKDMDWDYSPLDLYDPPELDFSNVIPGSDPTPSCMLEVSDLYVDFIRKVLKI